MEYIWALSSFFLFHSLINCIDTTEYSPCTNKSLENDIPVVSFCKESTADNEFIVLDGYYAHSNTEVTTCTCVARGQIGHKIAFIDANFVTAAIQPPCASNIKVSNLNSAFIMTCKGQGSTTFGDNGEITIVLTKLQTATDTRYCILVQLDNSGSTFNITCEGSSANVTDTPTHVQTTTAQTSLTTVPNGVPPQTTTSVSVSSSTVSDDKALETSTLGVTLSPQKDNEMLYIGVGVGCGAGLVIIIVVITVVICKRRSKTKTEENRRSDKDGDHDELPYNALYVSADANSNDGNHRNSVNKVMDNTTHDIEGNYSTVDLENQPVKTKASIKPAIAPKPKTKGNDKTSIKHVTAPGEGCVEYAVVDKQGRVSSVQQDKVAPSMTDNTYAVVNKERKRKPGDNNTNKTKEQMSRSNELSSESDEYRDKNRSSTEETTFPEEQHSQYSGEGQQALKTNSNNLLFSESTNYAEIDLPE